MLLYRLLRRFLRVLTDVFFRQVAVVGLEHVPAEGEGAVIFAGNHPNSLIDPVLIITNSGRITHFAAKDVLFKSALLRPLLKGLGAVPIARRDDHGPDGASNDDAFAALNGVLASGRAMGIFPEGLSHDEAHLARLKTGAARIALSAARAGTPLRIIPVGLCYVSPKRFRSRALLQFGTPIEVGPALVEAAAADERAAVRSLTDDLELRLRGLTVNADDWATLRVLDAVRRLYQPRGIAISDRIELARRFSSVYATIRSEPEVTRLYTEVAEYQARLDDVGITDRDLGAEPSVLSVIGHLLRHLALVLVWLPLALPGALVHAPIGVLAAFAGRTLTPRKDVVATTKLLAGLLLTLLAHAAIIVAAGLLWGWQAALATAVAFPVTGYAALRVFDRSTSIGRWGATLLRLSHMRDELKALRELRARLESAVVAAVERYKPSDMVALFARRSEAPPR